MIFQKKYLYFFLASSSGVPGVLHGCCLSGMLGVIKLFLDGFLALFATAVLGVLWLVLGVFTLCCVGVFRGVFWDDLVVDGVFVAGFPAANIIYSQTVTAILPVDQRKVASPNKNYGKEKRLAKFSWTWSVGSIPPRNSQYPSPPGGWNQLVSFYTPGGLQSCESPGQKCNEPHQRWILSILIYVVVTFCYRWKVLKRQTANLQQK